jgi:hypothetical protein
MDSTDLAHQQQLARSAYEFSRVRRALLGFSPLAAVLVGVGCAFGDRPSWTLSLGAGLFLLGATLLWHGRDLGRAVLPGVVAGCVPLVLVLSARHFGHVCTGASCSTVCMQACAVGGIAAGIAVASVGNARRSGPGFWLAASALAVLTGAMACACLGASGIAGLVLGYSAGVAPGLLRRIFAAPAR